VRVPGMTETVQMHLRSCGEAGRRSSRFARRPSLYGGGNGKVWAPPRIEGRLRLSRIGGSSDDADQWPWHYLSRPSFSRPGRQVGFTPD